MHASCLISFVYYCRVWIVDFEYISCVFCVVGLQNKMQSNVLIFNENI